MRPGAVIEINSSSTSAIQILVANSRLSEDGPKPDVYKVSSEWRLYDLRALCRLIVSSDLQESVEMLGEISP
jgi:hypothetical protein